MTNRHTSSGSLATYFVASYLLTWVFTIPLAYCYRVVLEGRFAPWLLLFIPGAYGPTIAALALTYRQEGGAGIKALLRRLILWRVHPGWYAAVVLLPTAWVLLSVALSSFRSEAFAGFAPLELLAAVPLYWLLALPFGPLAEELGWRGYALPRLQQSYSPVVSSLILSVAWTFWHTPMFWFAGAAIPSFLEISWQAVGLYFLQTTALTLLFTVLFNHTRGSVLIAILFHTTTNAAENIVFAALPEATDEQRLQVYLWSIGLMWVLALFSLLLTPRRSLARAA